MQDTHIYMMQHVRRVCALESSSSSSDSFAYIPAALMLHAALRVTSIGPTYRPMACMLFLTHAGLGKLSNVTFTLNFGLHTIVTLIIVHGHAC